jgi:serine/threonine-protein kinase RsbW
MGDVGASDLSRAVAPRGPGDRRQWAVAAQEHSLRTLRSSLRAWLAGVAWPQVDAGDVVLAVDAAVANSVEHAGLRPGEFIEVTAWTVGNGPDDGRRRVAVQIRDYGCWHSGPVGRGLTLMNSVMADVRTRSDLQLGGTEVTLTSRPDRAEVSAVPSARPGPGRWSRVRRVAGAAARSALRPARPEQESGWSDPPRSPGSPASRW